MKVVCVLLILLSTVLHAQGAREKIDSNGLMKLMLEAKGEVRLSNVDIYFNSDQISETLIRDIKRDAQGRIVLPNRLVVQDSDLNFYSKGILFSSIWLEKSNVRTFLYENGNTSDHSRSDILINGCSLDDFIIMESSVSLISYENTNDKGPIRLLRTDFTNLHFSADIFKAVEINGCHVNNVTFNDTQIGSTTNKMNTIEEYVISGGDYQSVEVVGNNVQRMIILSPSISQSLIMRKNTFGSIALNSTLEDFYFDIDWEQISGDRIAYATDSSSRWKMISPSDTSVVLVREKYFTVSELYSKLIARYRTLGRLEDANAAFVEFRDLEGARYHALFELKGKSNSYFRWKLNRLMKFYTDHGTDPSKAIAISIYIVALFGVFYVFFPSDWDTVSKSRLVQNFNDFRKKNAKGYVKPFLLLIGGFTLSFLNALALSLNAFTTLGFGNIPTHGVARYVCILEGFIGWFLLSIFTVALFNQVQY